MLSSQPRNNPVKVEEIEFWMQRGLQEATCACDDKVGKSLF